MARRVEIVESWLVKGVTIYEANDEVTGALVHYEVDLGPPLLPKILTTTIAPINLKCATLTVSEKSVINHEFRIPLKTRAIARASGALF